MPYVCPVCGFPDLKELPRGKTTGGSYEICPSCGFQFGVSDEDEGITYEEWRQQWMEKGMPWESIGITKPENWAPRKQLQKILN